MVWPAILTTLLKNEGETLSLQDIANIGGGEGGETGLLEAKVQQEAAKKGPGGQKIGIGDLIDTLTAKDNTGGAPLVNQDKKPAKAQRGRSTGTETASSGNSDLDIVKQTEEIRKLRLDSQLQREKIREQQFKTETTMVKSDKDELEYRNQAAELEAAIAGQDPTTMIGPQQRMTDEEAAAVASPLLRGLEVRQPTGMPKQSTTEQSISEGERAIAMLTPQGREQQEAMGPPPQEPLATPGGVQSLATTIAGSQDPQPVHGPPESSKTGPAAAARALGLPPEMLERAYADGAGISAEIDAFLNKPPSELTSEQKKIKAHYVQAMQIRGDVMDKLPKLMKDIENYSTLSGTNPISQQLGGILDFLSFGAGLGTTLFGRDMNPTEKYRAYSGIVAMLNPSVRMGADLANTGAITESMEQRMYREAGMSDPEVNSWLSSAAKQTGRAGGSGFITRRKRAKQVQGVLTGFDVGMEGLEIGWAIDNDKHPESQAFNTFIKLETMRETATTGRDMVDLIAYTDKLNAVAKAYADKNGLPGLKTINDDFKKTHAYFSDQIKQNTTTEKYGASGGSMDERLMKARWAGSRRFMAEKFHKDFTARVNKYLGVKQNKQTGAFEPTPAQIRAAQAGVPVPSESGTVSTPGGPKMAVSIKGMLDMAASSAAAKHLNFQQKQKAARLQPRIPGYGYVGKFTGGKSTIRNFNEAVRKWNAGTLVPTSDFIREAKDKGIPVPAAFSKTVTMVEKNTNLMREHEKFWGEAIGIPPRNVKVERPLYGYIVDEFNHRRPLTDYNEAYRAGMHPKPGQTIEYNARFRAVAERRNQMMPDDIRYSMFKRRALNKDRLKNLKKQKELEEAVQRPGPLSPELRKLLKRK